VFFLLLQGVLFGCIKTLLPPPFTFVWALNVVSMFCWNAVLRDSLLQGVLLVRIKKLLLPHVAFS
jgi:hypothetical protein